MRLTRLAIGDLVEVQPARHGDARGYFSEIFKRSAFEAEGIRIDWIQDNQAFSAEAGTVRGLHFQRPPHAQDKLIRALRGAIFDVAVDIRDGSPTYGRWVGVELSAEQGNQLLVPAGFAHGYMTLQPDTEVLYKVSAPYAPADEMAIRWDDPDIGIDWPDLGVAPVLSGKDKVAPFLIDHVPVFAYRDSR